MSDRKSIYWERKLAGKCVDCAAVLPDDDGVRCPECRDTQAARDRRYAKTSGAKRVRRDTTAARRAARAESGLCPGCGRAPENGKWCSSCLHQRKLSRLGLAQPRERKSLQSATWRELHAYNPIDEQEQSFRVRILRALRWMGWVDTRELFSAMSIDDDPSSTERNSAQVMLGRLVKLGLVEKRHATRKWVGVLNAWADYRITDAGRAEVARYQSGDLGRTYIAPRRRRAA